MMICPTCRSEFRAGFERCKSCNVDLVAPGDVEERGRPDDARAQLEGKELVVVPQGNLAAARELEKSLLDGGFMCYVHAEEADMDVAFGSAAAMQYGIVIARENTDAIREFLKGQFASMVETEGQGIFNTEAIDLEADTITCPACGHSGPLDAEGACADCGLTLGV